ncbi:MAG: DUF4388 domain-containing protein [Verrucomicrobia bacterium]|nr:DUF4388 domain-containing protein [Verrucomicrobiota bacterium]
MAIFGDFSEIPPPEVLTAVGRRTGVLAAQVAGQALEVQLKNGFVLNFLADGLRTSDVLALSSRFGRLLEAKSGPFEFHPLEQRGEAQFYAPIDQLVASTLRSLSERDLAAAELPSALTVFVVTGRDGLHLPEDLQLFWERAYVHLQLGAAPLQLSGSTGVTALEARWHLHRLRLAGLVRPRRADERTDFGRRLSESDALAPIAVTAGTEASGPGAELGRVRLQQPPRSLLGRMMDGLSRLFR